ncbi:MAG: tRNA lysidine(34) synthetase TilS, partial [Gammaproteobacteria bacterium]
LVLPTGTLSMKVSSGTGLSSSLSQKGIIIRGRAGGERCKPQGRSKSQKLKKLFQEYGVPPWERNRIPLIYIGDDLAAVSDLWVCEDFLAEKDEEGIILNWTDNLRN